MRFDPQDRSGRTAIASCSPMATHRCSCRPCSLLERNRDADYESVGSPRSPEDIRRFRQLDGVLLDILVRLDVRVEQQPTARQGVATSVGRRSRKKWLANPYNRPGFDIFDYNVYAICGDGCLMEGIGSEAASIALTWGSIISLDYDNNHITIEGNTRITFTEDVEARFLAYGWNVLRVGNANDLERIEHALDIFQKTQERPTFIVLDSHIGYGSPHKQDTAAAHGAPLGEEEVRLVKRFYGWPEDANSWYPMASTTTLPRGSAHAVPSPT